MSPSYLCPLSIGRPRRPRQGRRSLPAHEAPPIPNGRSRIGSNPIHVRSKARPRARSPRVRRVVAPAPLAGHVSAPTSLHRLHQGRPLRTGLTWGWRVGPLWRRGSADRPEERGRDGVRRSGNGRRRRRGVYNAWHLGASLSLFKIYNYYSQHTKRGGASKRRIGTRELAQEREEKKLEREREVVVVVPRWWWRWSWIGLCGSEEVRALVLVPRWILCLLSRCWFCLLMSFHFGGFFFFWGGGTV